MILEKAHLQELVRLTNDELVASLQGVKARLLSNERQMVNVDGRLEKLYDALETGSLQLVDLASRIKDLRNKRDLLERAQAESEGVVQDSFTELVNAEKLLAYLSDVRSVLDAGSVGERRLFLRSFVKRIVWREPEVTIHYTLPMPPATMRLGSGVLDIVQDGGAW